ncbi:universal stress protein [Mycobacterium paragordonae]|uniref:Universal stress protein n=1 Tax=Mycobacterium paragordonae TaxID=1389713 RepID=A0A386U8G0_9MYCO|nr:universal stress protein [Mycobacterium paragordonae]AYE96599.1 universal stress protein [Mycobacterium paragordonae]MDP7734188.1 universal stress protein [Mycobacterium paragordonae]TDK97218.1 universal stress protein [Mycobacterium paragordonae]TDK99119.1 universal stress protein [Mycobacterium paragordonae]TDL11163.1 universal stress protein [Mycobacterium paragordonae]
MNQLDAKSVVVGVNGSQAAVNAAKWAIDEALSRQMPLRLVYVITGKDTGSTQASDWELERAEMVLSQAESAVLSAAQAEGKPVEIETAIRSGDPARALINTSQDAALVCVGTSRRGWAADGLLGPTAAALVTHAHCPVAVIRTNPDGSPTQVGVIAVVLNDDPDNDEVVRLAMEEGRRRHAIVRQIDRRLDSWVRRYPDVPVQIVASGTGARADENHSRAIDLAIVGESEAAELPGLATPNCHPILGYPDCSVLLVRH